MTILKFKSTIAENKINICNKEPFFEFDEVIKYCQVWSHLWYGLWALLDLFTTDCSYHLINTQRMIPYPLNIWFEHIFIVQNSNWDWAKVQKLKLPYVLNRSNKLNEHIGIIHVIYFRILTIKQQLDKFNYTSPPSTSFYLNFEVLSFFNISQQNYA